MSYNTTAWTTDGQTQTIGGATLYKDFGIYNFESVTGTHYGMIANNMMFSDSGDDYAGHTGWGTGTDPATSLDVSGHASYSLDGFAQMWYLEDNITIDKIRVFNTGESSVNINYHMYSYDYDSSTGDLTNGTLVAHIGTVIAQVSSAVKSDTLTLDSPNVAANKVLIAFFENEGSDCRVSSTMQVKYHLT